MAGGDDIIRPVVSRWESGPGVTPKSERIMAQDLPVGVSRIGEPMVGEILARKGLETLLDCATQEGELNPVDLILEAADALEDSISALTKAEIERTQAELDFRHVFFHGLTDDERQAVIAAHPQIDRMIAKINNGHRYTDRSRDN